MADTLRKRLQVLIDFFDARQDLDWIETEAINEAAAELDRREARLTAVEQALKAVLSDAALEDDYERIHSDGRFISKGALLDCRAALKG